jgi:hypothetical protein
MLSAPKRPVALATMRAAPSSVLTSAVTARTVSRYGSAGLRQPWLVAVRGDDARAGRGERAD